MSMRAPCPGQTVSACNCPKFPGASGVSCHYGMFISRDLAQYCGNHGDVLCWSSKAPKLDSSLRTARASGMLHEVMHLYVAQLQRKYGAGTRQRAILDKFYRFIGGTTRKQPAELLTDCLTQIRAKNPPSIWLYYVQKAYALSTCPADYSQAAHELLKLLPNNSHHGNKSKLFILVLRVSQMSIDLNIAKSELASAVVCCF